MTAIREMTAADLPAVLDLRGRTAENAMTADELRDEYGIMSESLAEAMQADVKGWLCEVDGAVVGFAMGDRSNGEVQVVAVLPGHEGKGIGNALLARVRDWLAAEGHAEIWLRANPDPAVRASGFYARLGWRKTGEIMGTDEVLKLRIT